MTFDHQLYQTVLDYIKTKRDPYDYVNGESFGLVFHQDLSLTDSRIVPTATGNIATEYLEVMAWMPMGSYEGDTVVELAVTCRLVQSGKH
jgi:hypothetical protein